MSAAMDAEGASLPDWRDAAAYAPLLGADRTFFAWEWLRRDASYRKAALLEQDAPVAGAASFGLVAYEPPALRVPRARPVWSSAVHAGVLRVSTGLKGSSKDCFDVGALGSLVTLVGVGGREHLLLSDGIRALRLEGRAGTFSRGPVPLHYHLSGIASAAAPLLTLRRLLALSRARRFSASLHPGERKARRWILMLRASDALAAGANQREIACHLISRSAAYSQWRSREPSVRAQAQRLVRAARVQAGGGWRVLLR